MVLHELVSSPRSFDPDRLASPTAEQLLLRRIDKSKLKDNGDGTWDYDGDLDLKHLQLKSLLDVPYRFRHVVGNLYCDYNLLTSLKGAPERVEGLVNCSHNQLVSLKGAPEYVGSSFYCSYNQLVTLEGAPRMVLGSFVCSHNALTSLNGSPRFVGGDFVCRDNLLSSLEGSPSVVLGNYDCSYNNLVSLEGITKKIGGRVLCKSNFVNLMQIKRFLKENKMDFPQFDPEQLEAPSISEIFLRRIDKSKLKDNGDGTWDYQGTLILTYMEMKSLLQFPFRLRRVTGSFYCSHNKLITLEGAPERVDRWFFCSYNQLESLKGAPKYVGKGFICICNKLTTLEGAPEYVGESFNCSVNPLVSLKGLPKYIGKDLLVYFTQLESKKLPSYAKIQGKVYF